MTENSEHDKAYRPTSNIERWLVPAIILVLCGAAFGLSTGFERMPPILKRGIQPSDFPQLIAGLIALLTLLALYFEPVKVSSPIGRTTWQTLALMLVFVSLISIDFFLALGVFAGLLAWLWGERRPHFIIGVGALAPFLVFFLFDQLFSIRFPRGVLTNLWYG